MKHQLYTCSTKQFKGKYYALVFAALFAVGAMAQAPRGFNYQSVVRNGAGSVVANQHVKLRFSIHNGSLGGPVNFQETDTATTTPAGIITIIIGEGNLSGGNWNDINWAVDSKFLQVEIDVAGGNNFVDMGTTQLVSVPYAQYANTAAALTLADDSVAPVNGPDTIHVIPSTPYIEVTSNVVPSAAPITLTNGTVPGQCIVILGTSMGTSNGVRFASGGNLNVGTTGGPRDLRGGSTLMLMWSGSQWVQMSYSQNN